MRAVDLLRCNFEQTEALTMPIFEDLREMPLAAATPGGNQALWIFGHLTYCEGLIARQFLLGVPNELDAWAPTLGPGSRPEEDLELYPSWDEIVANFRQARDRTLAWLATQEDEDLDLPCLQPPEGMDMFFPNRGVGLSIVISHWWNHRGQLCDIRKTLGRSPIFR
ncbi:DinB family protein [Blastopirellula sp. JC732]|uniref:DinB family protein n=1 Tax=Blastopirellula sediminis TaxID=2894196 RepID=A0A9X1MMT4_9BACT|nr:DinB family protein [Blastopirellula sediminis]MCC9606655.1 DinB family protein [Blastopirellula sediminis]MCC9630048.1 DinB family protein [Blastopirellula sediminis]